MPIWSWVMVRLCTGLFSHLSLSHRGALAPELEAAGIAGGRAAAVPAQTPREPARVWASDYVTVIVRDTTNAQEIRAPRNGSAASQTKIF